MRGDVRWVARSGWRGSAGWVGRVGVVGSGLRTERDGLGLGGQLVGGSNTGGGRGYCTIAAGSP